jgi:hypothetical protein
MTRAADFRLGRRKGSRVFDATFRGAPAHGRDGVPRVDRSAGPRRRAGLAQRALSVMEKLKPAAFYPVDPNGPLSESYRELEIVALSTRLAQLSRSPIVRFAVERT